MWSVLCFKVLRKMQRRHSSITDSLPPERNRSQAISSDTNVDEGGVFESLKTEAPSPQQLFSGLGGIPSGSISATPFQSSLLLGSSAGGGEVFIQMPAAQEEGPNRAEAGLYHYRPPHHHYHHSHPRGPSLLHMSGADRHGHAEETPDEPPGTPAPSLPEMKAVISWLQDGLPFIMILLAKVCFQHKLGIALCVGMASTFAYANSALRDQISLKEKRSIFMVFWILVFLAGNTLYLLYTFNSQQLYNSLIFLKPKLDKLDFFNLMWMVGITDFVLKYLTIALKCLVLVLPKIILAVKSKARFFSIMVCPNLAFRVPITTIPEFIHLDGEGFDLGREGKKRITRGQVDGVSYKLIDLDWWEDQGKFYLVIEEISQLFRSLVPIQLWYKYIMGDDPSSSYFLGGSLLIMYSLCKSFDICGRLGSVTRAVKVLCAPQSYGVRASNQQCSEAGDICAICQAEFREAVMLLCQHVFCEECLCLWFDREKTCPLCRSVAVETVRCWKDGTTSAHFQVY